MMSIQLRLRDKLAIGGALIFLSLVGWMLMLNQMQMAPMSHSHTHEHMAHMASSATNISFFLYLATWMVMVIAMMLPSAGPMVMTFAAVSQRRRLDHRACAPLWLFVLGYLLAWGGSGLAAFAISTLLPIIVQAVPDLEKYSGFTAGIVLILAGGYQFSSLKHLCLSYCRTPLGYILTHWRDGYSGALLMGLHHGLYCIGCCWALMAIMLAAGIMNVAWMALLALLMFIEKVSARGLLVGKIAGILLIAAGVGMIAHAVL